MRKDSDQNKWTGVKIQQTVSINFTSIFILWWKAYYELQLESIPIYLPNIQLRSDPAPTEVSETLVQ